jgi:hypothetical protein
MSWCVACTKRDGCCAMTLPFSHEKQQAANHPFMLLHTLIALTLCFFATFSVLTPCSHRHTLDSLPERVSHSAFTAMASFFTPCSQRHTLDSLPERVSHSAFTATTSSSTPCSYRHPLCFIVTLLFHPAHEHNLSSLTPSQPQHAEHEMQHQVKLSKLKCLTVSAA